MVPFWIEWFHLPARVPNLEPGSKLQSYGSQAWNSECLISHGLGFICLQTSSETESPNFLCQKIHLTFCNIYGWSHSFILVFSHSSNMGTLTYIPLCIVRNKLRLLTAQTKDWISTVISLGKAERILLGSKVKNVWFTWMTILLSAFLYHKRLGLSMLSGANIKYFHTIEVFLVIHHLSASFTDLNVALFAWVSLGIYYAMSFQYTDRIICLLMYPWKVVPEQNFDIF